VQGGWLGGFIERRILLRGLLHVADPGGLIFRRPW
jgi:hypothetical protein